MFRSREDRRKLGLDQNSAKQDFWWLSAHANRSPTANDDDDDDGDDDGDDNANKCAGAPALAQDQASGHRGNQRTGANTASATTRVPWPPDSPPKPHLEQQLNPNLDLSPPQTPHRQQSTARPGHYLPTSPSSTSSSPFSSCASSPTWSAHASKQRPLEAGWLGVQSSGSNSNSCSDDEKADSSSELERRAQQILDKR